MGTTKKIGIITSGGDSPGMNAAIKSIVHYANMKNINCLGFKYGYDGLINNNYLLLSNNKVKDIIGFGGTIIGSGRSIEFLTKKGRKKAYKNYLYNKLDGLIIIGGNGTFTGVNKFTKEFNIPIIGIPGTIDNDIYGTDLTLGYDTALNTIIKTVDKIKDTANSNNRIFIVEVMGKKTGYLALNSGIALDALYIIFNREYNLKKLVSLLKKGNIFSKIIIVAENTKIGSASKKIYNFIKSSITNYEIRRTILGHIQRGGSPTCIDRILGIRLGLEAIKKIIKYDNNFVIGIKKNKIIHIPFEKSVRKKKIDINSIYIYNKFYNT
ncbi:MAG: 6-phosphofructokinase [Candidatus Shikimatogenerans bostrichidophilus]|nr:MAG: 6-phosphofructokinase [Candidatus Shikimatogenerans bostrichidophilus]